MATGVELWVDGALVDGAEMWWDDIVAALAGIDGGYPELRRVDPYGDVTFRETALGRLRDEADDLAQSISGAGANQLLRIAELCESAASADSAELKFVGD